MTLGAIPVYFELSWAILSSLSLLNVATGFLIVGITGFTPLWIVPVISSAGGAIANGLCYTAYYSEGPLHVRLPAAVIADIAWCVQEASLSFYSYQILRRFLRGRRRIIFLSLFWTMLTSIICFRIAILASRVENLLSNNSSKQRLIDHLHNGYFGSIAVVEVISAFFLLRIFAEGKRSSSVLPNGQSLLKQLIFSTELRVSSLALLGVGRAITYNFQVEEQSATGVANQVDRFLAVVGGYFPIIMFLDLLATRAVSNNFDSHTTTSRSKRTGAKSIDIATELNRINDDARQGMDRQTFEILGSKGADILSDSETSISKTTTISIQRTVEVV